MYQLAIFDLDGTLLNTLTDIAYACNYTLKSLGFPEHPIETYKTYVGNGVYKLIERMLPRDNQHEVMVKKAKEIFDAYYLVHSVDYTKPYGGVMTLLETLKEKGVQLAVASNKPDVYTQELVKLMFDNKISLAYGQREGVPAKPNPQVIRDIMEYFKVDEGDCIYIGDSDVDMYTAQNAGVTSVGVLWGFRSRKELIEAGAHYIASNVKELEKLILNS